MPACSVLVVDDDVLNLKLVAFTLRSQGYAVQTACNGAEALQVAEETRPDTVLLDMQMPILDGWGFAREARARGFTFPITVMSAGVDARKWASQIGATGCLSKPFSIEQLLKEVARPAA
jgi:two-component system OmpR family response regulator